MGDNRQMPDANDTLAKSDLNLVWIDCEMTGLDPEVLRQMAYYWEAVRDFYVPFETGMKAGDLIHIARVAATGRTTSPGIFEVLVLLGQARTVDRIRTLAAYLRFLTPDLFATGESFRYLMMAVVGGVGSPLGGLLASVVLTLVPEALRALGETNVRLLVYGTLVLVVLSWFITADDETRKQRKNVIILAIVVGSAVLSFVQEHAAGAAVARAGGAGRPTWEVCG